MFKIGAILDGIRTLKDGSVRLQFESQEISDEQGSSAISMRNKFGWLIFLPESVTDFSVPTESPSSSVVRRSPSQRFRAVLYVRWKQLVGVGKCANSFNEYYQKRMDELINLEKENLE